MGALAPDPYPNAQLANQQGQGRLGLGGAWTRLGPRRKSRVFLSSLRSLVVGALAPNPCPDAQLAHQRGCGRWCIRSRTSVGYSARKISRALQTGRFGSSGGCALTETPAHRFAWLLAIVRGVCTSTAMSAGPHPRRPILYSRQGPEGRGGRGSARVPGGGPTFGFYAERRAQMWGAPKGTPACPVPADPLPPRPDGRSRPRLPPPRLTSALEGGGAVEAGSVVGSAAQEGYQNEARHEAADVGEKRDAAGLATDAA